MGTRAFEWKPLALVGEASYSLYLLHQYVGVTLIALVGSVVGAAPNHWSAFSVPLVAAVMILFSLSVYRHWEVPAKRKLLDLGRPLLNGLRNLSLSAPARMSRSEEHTSELQSPDHLVCR